MGKFVNVRLGGASLLMRKGGGEVSVDEWRLWAFTRMMSRWMRQR
jgi:hypothetical protein